MTTIWRWIRTYWYVPVALLGIWLGWALLGKRGRGTPVQQTVTELAAISAAGEVRNVMADRDAEAAKRHVEQTYRQELDALNARQRAQARELQDDPAKLAAFLVRAAGGRV